jgi:hypothetical protein
MLLLFAMLVVCSVLGVLLYPHKILLLLYITLDAPLRQEWEPPSVSLLRHTRLLWLVQLAYNA